MKTILKKKTLYCVTCKKDIEKEDIHVHDGLGHEVVWRIQK